MGHRCRTKTSFVREDPTCNTIFDSCANGDTNYAAANCVRAESAYEDGLQSKWNLIDLNDKNDDSKDEIEQCHERYEFFSNLCDTVDPTKNNNQNDNCKNDTSNVNWNTKRII